MKGRNPIVLEIPECRRPTTTGEMLVEEFLKPLGVTKARFARHIGMTPASLDEILSGRRPLTLDVALRFEKAVGMSAVSWLSLQFMGDVYDARTGKRPKAIQRIRKIAALREAS